jgi:predicted nucleic acid-binding Zn ribbon protein
MKHKGTDILKVKKCLYCNNPTYGMNKYCSKKCKAKMKKLKRLKKLYFNDKTGRWAT